MHFEVVVPEADEEAADAAEIDPMKVAIASGKGGTGKTSVAVALALSAQGSVEFLDCDVEEPNAHFFLKPEIRLCEDISLEVPVVIQERCNYCGKCRDMCRFNAITVFGETIMTFPDMCHSCGGCFLVCPQEALEVGRRLIGTVELGTTGRGIGFVQGRLRIGEAMAPPLIRAVKARSTDSRTVIIDCPPGTSCPAMVAVRDADYCLLVTEPTPFGLHDLKIMTGVLKRLKVSHGVVLNRAGLGDDTLEHWCLDKGIPIHLKIPFSRKIAEAYAKGIPMTEVDKDLRDAFTRLILEIGK